MTLFKSKPNLPPGYEIRRGSKDFFHVHDPDGVYIGNAVDLFGSGLKRARRIAWDDFNGRGRGTVVERG